MGSTKKFHEQLGGNDFVLCSTFFDLSLTLDGMVCLRDLFILGLLRCGKSCRLRWTNYLRPDIKRGPFTPEEEKLVIQLHGILGNR